MNSLLDKRFIFNQEYLQENWPIEDKASRSTKDENMDEKKDDSRLFFMT